LDPHATSSVAALEELMKRPEQMKKRIRHVVPIDINITITSSKHKNS